MALPVMGCAVQRCLQPKHERREGLSPGSESGSPWSLEGRGGHSPAQQQTHPMGILCSFKPRSSKSKTRNIHWSLKCAKKKRYKADDPQVLGILLAMLLFSAKNRFTNITKNLKSNSNPGHLLLFCSLFLHRVNCYLVLDYMVISFFSVSLTRLQAPRRQTWSILIPPPFPTSRTAPGYKRSATSI